jgi:folate-binding protein YgfZ
MSAEYENFLSAQKVTATIDANGDAIVATTPPLPTLLDRNVIAALPIWSVLQIAGPDSAKFLQGQLTCDIAAATPAQALPGAHCTPKGRMRSSFLIVQRADDSYWLRTRSDISADAATALGKYIVFSKAKIAPQTQLLAIGLSGPGAAAAIAAFAGKAPQGMNAVIQTVGGVIVQRDAVGQRFEAWLPADAAETLWRWCGDFLPVSSTFWRWREIVDGLASVTAPTVESFIPLMLNYDQIGAISFTKGCYTGQEIVARTHYRGQVKRHLVRAEVQAPPPAPGTSLTDANGRAIGEIVEAVQRGDGSSELLAVVASAANGDENVAPELRLHLTETIVPGGGVLLRVL